MLKRHFSPIYKTAIYICDLQTRPMQSILNKDHIIHNANFLLDARQNIPPIHTAIGARFLPDKLGDFYPSLHTDKLDYVYDKSTYSMHSAQIHSLLQRENVTHVILAGIQTECCINATLLDLIHTGYRVSIPIDAVSTQHNHPIFIDMLRETGAHVNTTQGILCNLLHDANTPAANWFVRYIQSS